MIKHLALKLIGGAVLGCLAAACASSQPTPELVDARRAYDQARSSNAAQLVPDQLLSAKQALDRAESAHQQSAGSNLEKTMAYIAQRKAALAISLAGYAQAERDLQSADEKYKNVQGQKLKTAEKSIEESRDALRKNREQLERTNTALQSEKVARMEAEKKAAAAMASLQEIAKVKEEQRGMVITLDGSVLFATGKTTLLAIAEQKLAKVAEVLQKQDDSKQITVEGHTDSVGSDEDNVRLSQGRADSVRTYLVSQGVPGARIKAVGRGESMPIADNKTPEGRANNRRVEIIVGN
jgi:outer membrane protein OmpA-like peptidoglycan-associated protein